MELKPPTLALLLLAAPAAALAQAPAPAQAPAATATATSTPAGPPAPDTDFIYHARLHDTLIGLSRRLLVEPRRWPEVQARNHIKEPTRIPPGSDIRIPYAWLRTTAETATVVNVNGTATQSGNALAPGATLAEGSSLSTGTDGSVTLRLADGSLVTLQKSSTLDLQQMRGISGERTPTHDTRLRLESGRLQTAASKQAEDSRYEIATPVAISAVRGTQFRTAFTPDDHDGTTETLEGTVGVQGGNTTVAVGADFGTKVRSNAPPLPPVQLLPPPELAATLPRNATDRLRLQWPPVPGAAAYRLQLAPDPQFHTLLADQTFNTPQAELAAPADGDYWVRVRSIDNQGLEGLDAARALTQHLAPPVPVPATPVVDANVFGTGTQLAWNDVGSAYHYRVQIAADREFTRGEFDQQAAQPQVNTALAPGQHFWRVAAVNQQGEAGDWSLPVAFHQRANPPRPQPPVFAHRQAMLRWRSEPGVRYHVQIARHEDFSTPVVDREVDSAEITIPAPDMLSFWFARVQTLGPDGSASPYGETRRFLTPVPVWLKNLWSP